MAETGNLQLDLVVGESVATVSGGKAMRLGIWFGALVFVSAGCREGSPRALGLPHSVEGAEPIAFRDGRHHRKLVSSVDLHLSYTATVSHGYFTSEPDEDIDFLEVAIEYPTSHGAGVCMKQSFKLDDLPADILDRDAGEIVSTTNDSIVFDLGTVTVRADKPWGR